ncbi:DUF2927 domain-containing protein [Brevirhabdus sp.]|uniref:DUF2927 domain-containing protein n=1 Tax=Brevirhabdus sp. TaxID=2004514 RepID=UPI004059D4F7
MMLTRLISPLLLALTVAACQTTPPKPVTVPDTSQRPQVRPKPAVVKPKPKPVSSRAAEYHRYYVRAQARQRSQGLLRTDTGSKDAPFTTRNLIENFERVALYDEYTVRNGRFVAEQTPSRLRRWEGPIRMKIIFGPSVDAAQRKRDTDNVRNYAARLARLTGADIRLTEGTGNYFILVMNTDELAEAGPKVGQLVPGIGNATVNEITDLPRYTFCSVYAFSEGDTYSAAIAVIRAEHPDLLRLSCLHEELAQGLGAANDSPTARPSIFNDDEEFALLTPQDEMILKILYDRRLKPGMTPELARPIVAQIAAELMGGES